MNTAGNKIFSDLVPNSRSSTWSPLESENLRRLRWTRCYDWNQESVCFLIPELNINSVTQIMKCLVTWISPYQRTKKIDIQVKHKNEWTKISLRCRTSRRCGRSRAAESMWFSRLHIFKQCTFWPVNEFVFSNYDRNFKSIDMVVLIEIQMRTF